MQSTDIAWDEVNNLEVRSVSGASGFDFETENDIEYIVNPTPGQALPIRSLYSGSDSSTLVVSFHGSLKRSKYRLPRFEWRQTLGRLEVGRLFLSDTSLELSEKMPLGWYVGTAAQNLTADIAEFVSSVAEYGGYTNVVFIGSSGGGYAAMAVSRRVRDSLAICFSPQTRISKYSSFAHKKFVHGCFSEYENISDVETHFGPRVNLIQYYRETDPINYVRYVQNTLDKGHLRSHFVPFAESLGLPQGGGRSAEMRINAVLEPMHDGHHPPSKGKLIGHLIEGHAEVFGTEPVKKMRP